MNIIGAGMTGCLAGLIFPRAEIFEAQSGVPVNHKAVLRFRDESVSHFTGIPFRKVVVRKGICVNGKFVQPDINVANAYSLKVLGAIADRSIWNINSVERYIAPSDFQYQLSQMVRERIHVSAEISNLQSEPVVSTIPLPSLLKLTSIDTDLEFNYASIYTARFKLKNVDVFQTVYFPEFETHIYRATVTGDNLILEATAEIEEGEVEYVLHCMGLTHCEIDCEDNSMQAYGKIKNVDDVKRRGLIWELTSRHNVFSAGRFAVWKNILMDDVLSDLYTIKKMYEANPYARKILEIKK